MNKGFNLIKSKALARGLAIGLIAAALAVMTLEFILDIVFEGFYFENLFAYFFELVFSGGLLYAIIVKNPPIIEICLVVLKVFEGSYYPLRATQRIDAILNSNVSNFELANHLLFALAALLLLIALIFFCIYKYKNLLKYWDIMKFLLLGASLLTLVSTILYLVFSLSNAGQDWEEILQPAAMSLLCIGMFMTCEYVEEETIYAK